MKLTFILTALLSLPALAGIKTYKMYGSPNVTPTPGCDVHTVLAVTEQGYMATAKLVTKLSGFCEIYVLPNPRTYKKLIRMIDDCGSVIYLSQDRQVKITDNSKRLCENVILARVVVEEYGDVLYSHDK